MVKNAITFDIEDWCQAAYDGSALPTSAVVDNTQRALCVLAETKTMATFFILGSVANRYPELVRQIGDAGHEVALHGYNHQPVSAQSPRQFLEDIRRARATIEDIVGRRIVGFRAPDFSISRKNWWAMGVLESEGFLYDSSVFPIFNKRYGNPFAPRFPFVAGPGGILMEFPISTLRLCGLNLPFAGGSYLRLLPYTLIRQVVHHINGREKQPAIIYFHPYELALPEGMHGTGGSWKRRLFEASHSLNQRSVTHKLRSLLKEFRFGRVAEVLDLGEQDRR